MQLLPKRCYCVPTQSLVVNEGKNGVWIVFWELKKLPEIKTDCLTASTEFQCAGNKYKVVFTYKNGGVDLNFQILSEGSSLKIAQ